jgi:hypothetical protein
MMEDDAFYFYYHLYYHFRETFKEKKKKKRGVSLFHEVLRPYRDLLGPKENKKSFFFFFLQVERVYIKSNIL